MDAIAKGTFDGDNDGLVYDGTPRQRPARPDERRKRIRARLKNRGERGAASLPPKRKGKTVQSDAKEGMKAGDETVTRSGAKLLKQLGDIASERHKNGDGDGLLILRALVKRKDKYAVNNLFHTYGLGDMPERDRAKVIMWLVKNGTRDSISGRRKSKAPRKEELLDSAGEIHHVERELGDTPNQRQLTESKITPGDPGRINIRGMRQAVAGAGLKGYTVRTTKLTEQNIVNRGGERPDHSDPTANKALRSVRERSRKRTSRGGAGANERRAAARKAKQEAWLRRQKEGGIEKKRSPLQIASLLRAARARKFIEAKVRRDSRGRFADKPGQQRPRSKRKKNRKPRQPLENPASPAASAARNLVARLETRGERGAVGTPARKKPAKKKPANAKVKALEAQEANVFDAKRKRLTPKKQTKYVFPRSDADYDKRSGPIADFEAAVSERNDADDLMALAQAGLRTGKIKSAFEGLDKVPTMSEYIGIVDEKGTKYFIKRSGYDPSREDNEVPTYSFYDHIDDFVGTRLFEEMDITTPHAIGFAANPNDIRKGAIVGQWRDDVVPKDAKKVRHTPKDKATTYPSFVKADWADRREFMRIMVMDFIINNRDRHTNNFFEYDDKDGKRHIVPYDQSLSGAAAARARESHLQEVEKFGGAVVDVESLDDLPFDEVEASATRSFREFVRSGWDDLGENYNSEMARRVGVLYEGDMETFLDDLEEMLQEVLDKDLAGVVDKIIKDQKLEGDAAKEADDMAFIVTNRINSLLDDLDNPDENGVPELWTTIVEVADVWRAGPKASSALHKKHVAEQNDLLVGRDYTELK